MMQDSEYESRQDERTTGHLTLSRAQVRNVDRISIETFGVPGIVLMENAARGAAQAIADEAFLHRRVLILCGGGNNGGDGLAIARHLHNRGCTVTVGLCTDPARYQGDALINWNIVRSMNLPVVEATPIWLDQHLQTATPPEQLLIIDAIFGTGLSAAPRDPFSAVAERVNASPCPVVAIDLPSGLDCDTGTPLGRVAVRAGLTVTFVGSKRGFAHPASAEYTGRVKVVDIGCPIEAIEQAMRHDA